MSCPGVAWVCHAMAKCITVEKGPTCRCNDGYKGDGFTKCELDLDVGLPDNYLLAIILVVLLFVALVVIVVFVMCRRRLSDDHTMRQQLVGTMEVTAYESKWENIAGRDVEDGPPPYEEKHPAESDGVLGSFHPGEVTVGRITVGAEDGEVDQTDDVKDFDNPTYDAVANVKTEVVVDDDIGGIDNPTYDAGFEASVTTDVAASLVAAEVVEDEPSVVMEGQLESAPVYDLPEDEVEVKTPGVDADIAVVVVEDEVSEEDEEHEDDEDEEEEEDEKAIAVTFTEGDFPNTVSAHVQTPEANLTINLNISLPDDIMAMIE